jgi:phage anti-repressor protein
MREFNRNEFESLVKIQNNNKLQIDTINARDLWEYLEVDTRFNDWIKNRIYKYQFVESHDYICLTKKKETRRNDGQKGSAVITEYHISINMAKELSMVENSNLGRAVRLYYIELEKELKEIRNNDDRQTALWETIRVESKIERKDFTDSIQSLVNYAIDMGASDGVKWYYKHITSALNKALFRIESLQKVHKNLRDEISYIQLSHIITLETILRNRILEMVNMGFEYKTIYENLKELCIQQGKLIGKEKPRYITEKEYKSCMNKKELKLYSKDQNLLF